MCSLPHAYMLFSTWKVFGPPCIFPRGDRRWGPIFSNYRAPLVIITTNQLVANFVKIHQYFTRTNSRIIDANRQTCSFSDSFCLTAAGQVMTKYLQESSDDVFHTD